MVYKKKGEATPEYTPKQHREEEQVVEETKVEGEEQQQEQTHTDDRRREDRYGDRRRRERRGDEETQEVVEEEEPAGVTFEEFLAQKKSKQANLKKAETRKHENVTAKNLEKVETQKEKIQVIHSQIKQTDLYNTGAAKTEFDNLLGFQGGADEEEFGERRGGRGGFRGGRGGRGGFRGGDRPRGGERDYRGGGRGKKLQFNAEAFPTL